MGITLSNPSGIPRSPWALLLHQPSSTRPCRHPPLQAPALAGTRPPPSSHDAHRPQSRKITSLHISDEQDLKEYLPVIRRKLMATERIFSLFTTHPEKAWLRTHIIQALGHIWFTTSLTSTPSSYHALASGFRAFKTRDPHRLELMATRRNILEEHRLERRNTYSWFHTIPRGRV